MKDNNYNFKMLRPTTSDVPKDPHKFSFKISATQSNQGNSWTLLRYVTLEKSYKLLSASVSLSIKWEI